MAKGIYMRFPKGRSKALTYSYDDGVETDIRFMDILNKYNMKGTFNINSGLYAPEGTMYPDGTVHRRMSESQCKEAYKNHEVAIHALTHPFLDELSIEHCTYEIMEDRKNLEALTKNTVRGMAYPYGTYSDEVVDVLRCCGIAYARTVESIYDFDLPKDWLRLTATCHHGDERLMELAKKFVELDVSNRPSKMFYLWGHTYEFDRDDNWYIIEEFAEFMANREDEIWYATNIEIYDYIKAYEQLVFDVCGTMCTNPTAFEIWLEKDGEMYSVNSGETIYF